MACACGCGKEVPLIVGECKTRFYASEMCAYRGMLKRRGLHSTLLDQQATKAAEKQAARAARPKPTPPPRREPTQDERDHSDLRYGPKRAVVEVLETYGDNGQRAKVKLECGHVRAWYAGEATARCMKCRPAPISGGSGPAKRASAPEVDF